MNTRTERMNNKAYCAYCGKELRDYNHGICPEPPLVCNCEKAKRELELYKEIRELYNMPLSESLIDMKVSEYRSKILGTYVPDCTTYTTLGSPITLSGSYGHSYVSI